MMNGASTPVTPVTQGKKRELTSPEFEFEIDLKKNRCASADSDSLSRFNSELETDSDLDLGNPEQITSVMMSGENSSELKTDTSSSTSHIFIPPSEMLKLSEMLKSTFRGEIVEMVNCVVEGVLKGLTDQMSSLARMSKDLISENKELKSRVVSLEKRADQAEQYSRRNCLRVSGFKEEPGENTDEIILKIANDIGSDTQLPDVDRSHRIGNPQLQRAKPRDILVKFSTYRNRQNFYRKRTALKSSGHSGVFINEDLTKFRSGILFDARKLVKAQLIKSAWSSDGNVLVKDNRDVVHRVTGTDDLQQFGHQDVEFLHDPSQEPTTPTGTTAQ